MSNYFMISLPLILGAVLLALSLSLYASREQTDLTEHWWHFIHPLIFVGFIELLTGKDQPPRKFQFMAWCGLILSVGGYLWILNEIH
jgi:hypothetical protein